MIERTKKFVCASDEVWRLQRGADPECHFFQTMIAGKAGALSGSHQGICIVTPGGKLLARRNSLSPDKVVSLIDTAWEKWVALPAEDQALAASPEAYRSIHRWENSFPKDGLALVSVLRDLPPAENSSTDKPTRWNRDHVWFNRNEARQWLPETIAVGSAHSIPIALAQRLARFHLVDNVRGQVGPFAREDIQLATFETTITAVAGNRVSLDIRGSTNADSDGVWKMGENDWKRFPNNPRTIQTELIGRATFDTEQQRFVEFEAAARGKSTGGVGLNGRRGADATGSIAYYLSLAPNTPRHRIAPAFIDVYDAPWVQAPPKN